MDAPTHMAGILSDVSPFSLDVTTVSAPPAPLWLRERLASAGGSVPFATYMAWALHDPDHGYYGHGRARIGPSGDFATSPSLGDEFASLLLQQLIEWLEQIPGDPLSLVETGPGEGQLMAQLTSGLLQQRPDLAARLEVVLLEPNPGMANRQRRVLDGVPLPLRWVSWEELRRAPVAGVVIAHEVLDALPVDRLVWDGSRWCWQHVACASQGTLTLRPGPPLASTALAELASLGLPAAGLPPGWCTESHPGLAPWFRSCAEALREGVLLVVDYAMEARRYYAPQRSDGTLLAYRHQRTVANPLLAPGEMDLTAHLCLETTRRAAAAAGWHSLGERRQGEALLALGLAERLAGTRERASVNLAEELARREQLLRLVDPASLGEFRWLVFERGGPSRAPGHVQSRCLREPGSEGGAAN